VGQQKGPDRTGATAKPRDRVDKAWNQQGQFLGTKVRLLSTIVVDQLVFPEAAEDVVMRKSQR